MDYTYADANNIDDKETREYRVNRLSSMINKYGIPDTSKWEIKHNPNDNFKRLVITIPLFKEYDSIFNLENGGISITFPPQQISNKMTNLEIVGKSKLIPTIPVPIGQQ